MTLVKPLAVSLVVVVVAAAGLTGCGQRDQVPPQPVGKDFSALVAGPLVRADGTEAGDGALVGKTVLVYFSAHWCPPCRAFTPELVKAYDTWKAQDKALELVFVSFDRDEAAMKGYMAETKMNWLAVPFTDKARREALADTWGVDGIPSLVVVAPDGTTLTTDGTKAVRAKKADAINDWIKP
jgi:nucleoredoxin